MKARGHDGEAFRLPAHLRESMPPEDVNKLSHAVNGIHWEGYDRGVKDGYMKGFVEGTEHGLYHGWLRGSMVTGCVWFVVTVAFAVYRAINQ